MFAVVFLKACFEGFWRCDLESQGRREGVPVPGCRFPRTFRDKRSDLDGVHFESRQRCRHGIGLSGTSIEHEGHEDRDESSGKKRPFEHRHLQFSVSTSENQGWE